MLSNPWVTIAKLRLFRSLGRKMLTSPGRVQMTTLVSACQSDLGSSNDEVRITVRCLHMLSDSRVMIAELRLFRGLVQKTLTSPGRMQMTTLVSACQSDLGSPNDEVRITVRCLRMLQDSRVMIAELRLFCGVGQKTLTSLGRV